MEALLKMSGLLTDEEAGKTDLGTLEKRLAEKSSTTNGPHPRRDSEQGNISTSTSAHQPTPSSDHTPPNDSLSSPHTSSASVNEEGEKDKREDVENLSEMMCSLVTNNCGETRYIGKSVPRAVLRFANHSQARLLRYPSSRRKVSNGSTKRPAIRHFKIL